MKIILNDTKWFYVFWFLHYMLYYNNVKLETCHIVVVNDLWTNTGTCVTTLSNIALDGIPCLHKADQYKWSTNTCVSMYRSPRENIAYEFVCTSLAAPSIYCLSYLDILWDGQCLSLFDRWLTGLGALVLVWV